MGGQQSEEGSDILRDLLYHLGELGHFLTDDVPTQACITGHVNLLLMLTVWSSFRNTTDSNASLKTDSFFKV